MQTIFAFKLPHFYNGEPFLMELLSSSKPLEVQMVKGVPTLFCLTVSDDKSVSRKRFVVFETGSKVPDSVCTQSYLGTFQNESLVLHLFEAPL